VNIQYYDPDKEQEYQQKKRQEEKTHGQDWVQKLPKSWKEEGGLYNPINGKIEDEKRLYERDLKEKNKRKRFELRYDMERQVHKQSLGEVERLDQISLNKINVQRFKDTTARGFDILTNKQFNNPSEEGSKTVYEPFVKPPPSTWTKIKNTSNAFDDFKYGSSNAGSQNNDARSEPKKLDDMADSGDLNDRVYDTVHDEFMQTSNIERRSKRLMKGSKTMSDFHKTNATTKPSGPVKVNPNPKQENAQNTMAAVKGNKEILPTKAENSSNNFNPNNRETNQSALRKSMNSSARHASKEVLPGSTAVRAGRNIVSQTPQSKHSSIVSSNRMIRTGAFQRIKA
jgi:hypothetical protein